MKRKVTLDCGCTMVVLAGDRWGRLELCSRTHCGATWTGTLYERIRAMLEAERCP